jgi:hypothetical protein
MNVCDSEHRDGEHRQEQNHFVGFVLADTRYHYQQWEQSRM